MIENKAQVLRDAALRVREGWTKGTYSTTENGLVVEWHSERAVNFCLSGAAQRAVYDAGGVVGSDAVAWMYYAQELYPILVQAVEKHDPSALVAATSQDLNPVSYYNDHVARDREDVARVLETAAELADAPA